MKQEKVSITKEQASEFAYVIFQEIKKYIKEHKEEYDAWYANEKIDT